MVVVDDDRLALLPRRFRGYAPDSVAALLAELDAGRDRIAADCSSLDERARELTADLDEARSLEHQLRDVFVSAQRARGELLASARSEAAAILAEVELGEEWHRRVDAAAADLRAEIGRMRALEDEFRAAIRTILTDALGRLDGPLEEPRPVRLVAVPDAADPAPPVEEDEAAARQDAPPSPSLEDDTLGFQPLDVPPPAAGSKPRFDLRSMLLSLAILVLGAAVAATIWLLRGDDSTAETSTGGVETAVIEAASGEQVVAQTSDARGESVPSAGSETETIKTSGPTRAVLVVRAVGGDSWLEAHAGSRGGKLLFEGFLYESDMRKFVSKRIWMRVGNGGNLRTVLNGKRLENFPRGTADVLVTAAGARTLVIG